MVGSLEHAPNYVLHIYPPAILHNYLPYNIRYAPQVRTSCCPVFPFTQYVSKMLAKCVVNQQVTSSSFSVLLVLVMTNDDLRTCQLFAHRPTKFGPSVVFFLHWTQAAWKWLFCVFYLWVYLAIPSKSQFDFISSEVQTDAWSRVLTQHSICSMAATVSISVP